MRRVASSSIVGSLEEILGSVVDEPADFALHLGWCLTVSHEKFTTRLQSSDFNCWTLRRVEKTDEESENKIKYVWNELKL
jgi:hypothetical protein